MFIPALDPLVVGRAIARFRQEKGCSQEAASSRANIGRSHLSAIERGERKPTLETLYRICGALDVKMSDVILAIEVELEKMQKQEDEQDTEHTE